MSTTVLFVQFFVLLYRYNTGSIVDVSTLKSTIPELSVYGVNVDFSILDTGYYSDKNIKALYEEGIRFVTRLSPNRKLYNDLIAGHVNDLESSGNAVFYRDRLLYIKRVSTNLCGNDAYAYVEIDHHKRSDELYNFMKRATEDKNLTSDEIDSKAKSKGVFIILSSENVETSTVLPL